ncbi:MAG: hypothetical protein ACC644_03165, partial [Candidatus Hydrothermarchaeales archaeon]
MDVKVIVAALIIVFIAMAGAVWYVDNLYKEDTESSRGVLSTLDFRFTDDAADEGFILASTQKYSDITFLDLTVEVENTGSGEVELKNPVV